VTAVAERERAAGDGARRVLGQTGERYRRRARKDRLIVTGGIIGLGVALLLFWEFGLEHIVNPRYVSSPSEVVQALGDQIETGQLWRNIEATMVAAGLGYLIGIAVGLTGAFLLLATRRGYEVLEPFLLAFYSIPKIALAPLFIMWFGLALTPKILLAALMVFFIVFMNTVAGVRAVDRGLVDVARVLGARRVVLIRKILIPAAAPSIMAAIRVTFARAMVGTILAEFIASTAGLGYMIVRAARQFDIATVFAGVVVIAALVMLVNAVIRFAESRLFPWASGQAAPA
jgi:NitT/TauT family transport system permease protein